MIYARIILLIGVFALSACVPKNYSKENSAFILLKTPSFKYADMGFIYQNAKEMKVEIYSNGQALMQLEILEERICLSDFKCMSKEQFNQTLLSSSYPSTLFENIFRGKAIFAGKNKKAIAKGFSQNIVSNSYTIEYSVRQDMISFEDRFNKIKIKIKK